jgi:hypothetical protein
MIVHVLPLMHTLHDPPDHFNLGHRFVVLLQRAKGLGVDGGSEEFDCPDEGLG